jgi:hypothetical protein
MSFVHGPNLFCTKNDKERTKTVRGSVFAKEEYDFTEGERGKFYHPDIEVNLPVYLEQDVAEFMRKLAEKKGTDVERIVNDWLRKNIELVQSAK